MKAPGTSAGGRFAKGKSGNPGGRPRKAAPPQASVFDVIVERTLTITRNGQAREITMEEALRHRTYQDAIAGKRLAQREVMKWIGKREAWLAKQAPQSARRSVTIKPSSDPDNADAALLLLGIATPDARWAAENPGTIRLKLEPWAVQAALARRRGSTSPSERDVAEILRCTRDPDSLRWPKEAWG